MRILLLCVFFPSVTLARFAFPPEAPVERLVKNVSAYVKENPKDAMGYYTLGRIHNLAFTQSSKTLRAFEREKLPNVPTMFNEKIADGDNKIDEKARLAHLTASMENYLKAMELDKDKALFHLGLASILDVAAASDLTLPPIPGVKESENVKDWKPIYIQSAIDHYWRAYDLSVKADVELPRQPLRGLGELVSWEAGLRHNRLTGDRGGQTETELKREDEIEKTLKALKAKPRGPVTPIIFSLERSAALAELVDPSKAVAFDLDGTGREQSWSWVKGDTAILVYDSRNTGRITSGHQLFGSVTFFMFWRDGYNALDALDDNRDGSLAGDELAGLSVWRDANQNGVSEAGEVVPVSSAGVVRISARATGRDGDAPANALGLELRDGRVLPTYDWIATRR